MPHPERIVSERNYTIYKNERHCENCANKWECWSRFDQGIVRKLPGMFFPRSGYNYNRVEHLYKRNVACMCDRFVFAEGLENRIFGDAGDLGWDK